MNCKLTIITVNKEFYEKIYPTIQSYLAVKKLISFNHEYLVLDSSNDTRVRNECIKNSIEYKYTPKSSIYDAMNLAKKFAKGEYILYLNSGNILLDNISNIEVLIDLKYDNIYFPIINYKGFIEYPLPLAILKAGEMPFSHQGVITKKNLVIFDARYKNHGDLFLYINLFKKGTTFKYYNFPLINSDQMESANIRVWRQRIEPYIALVHVRFYSGIVVRFILSIFNKDMFFPNKDC
jgi:hypothetical protein